MRIQITRQLSASFGEGVGPGTVHDNVTLKGNRAQFRKANGVFVTAPHGYYRVLLDVEETAAPAESDPRPATLEERLASAKNKDAIEEIGREHGVELDKRKTRQSMIDDLLEAVATE